MADVSPNLGRSQGPFRTIVGGLHAVMVQEGAIELVGAEAVAGKSPRV